MENKNPPSSYPGSSYYSSSYYNYRQVLLSELATRKTANPRFSLRAFARVLDMSPALLSQLISGKKNLSKKQASKIASKLMLSPKEKLNLFFAINPDLINEKNQKNSARILEEDQFALISEWYHYGILSLGDLPRNKANPKWIAKHLQIDEIDAIKAFDRLLRMELIEINSNGGFKQIKGPLDTLTDVPSPAIRKYHKQNLELAKEKIDTIDVHLREYCSMTMSIDKDDLHKAKKLIEEFRQKFCSELETQSKNSVYTISIQFFPISQIGLSSNEEK